MVKDQGVELKNVRKLTRKQAEAMLLKDPMSPAVFDCRQADDNTKCWRDDEAFALFAVGLNGMLLEHLEQFQENEAICKAAVADNASAAQFVSNQLLTDPGLRIAALKLEGGRLAFAPPESRSSEFECFAALTNNVAAFTYVDKRLYDNATVMLAVIKHDYTYFDRASARLKAEKTFLEQALAINPEVVKRLVHSREEALERVKTNGLLLRYLRKYARDEGVCKVAVKQNAKAVEWIADECLSNYSLCMAAVQHNGLRLKDVPGWLLNNTKP